MWPSVLILHTASHPKTAPQLRCTPIRNVVTAIQNGFIKTHTMKMQVPGNENVKVRTKSLSPNQRGIQGMLSSTSIPAAAALLPLRIPHQNEKDPHEEGSEICSENSRELKSTADFSISDTEKCRECTTNWASGKNSQQNFFFHCFGIEKKGQLKAFKRHPDSRPKAWINNSLNSTD